jgi:hypothetical protein
LRKVFVVGNKNKKIVKFLAKKLLGKAKNINDTNTLAIVLLFCKTSKMSQLDFYQKFLKELVTNSPIVLSNIFNNIILTFKKLRTLLENTRENWYGKRECHNMCQHTPVALSVESLI